MIKKKLFLTLICVLFSLTSAEAMKRPWEDGGCSPAKRQKIEAYNVAYTNDIIDYKGNVTPNPSTKKLSFTPPLNEIEINEVSDLLRDKKNFSFCAPSYTNYSPETTTVNFLKVDGVNKFVIKYNDNKVIKGNKSPVNTNKGFDEYLKCRWVYKELAPIREKLGIPQVLAALENNDKKDSFINIFSFTPGEDIYSILSSSSGEEIDSLLTAVAHYLADFHYEAIKKNQKETIDRNNIVTLEGRLLEKTEVFLLEQQKLKDKAKKLELHSTNSNPLWDANEDEINGTRKQEFYEKCKIIADEFCKNIDNLIDSGPTTIHGDAHGGNILSSKDILETSVFGKCLNYLGKDPNFWSLPKYAQWGIAKTQSILSQNICKPDAIKFIDYESMDYAIDPAVDVGRFIASLWQWGARDSKELPNTLYPKIEKWQKLIKQQYCDQLEQKNSKKKIFLDKTIEIIENNIDFYKYFTFQSILTSPKNAKELIMKRKLMNFWLKEFKLVPLPEIESNAVESKERGSSDEEKEQYEIEKRARAARRAAIKFFQFPSTLLKESNTQTPKILKLLNSPDKAKESFVDIYYSLVSELNSLLAEEKFFKPHLESTKKLKEELNKDNWLSFYDSIFKLYFNKFVPYYGGGSDCNCCKNPSLIKTKVLGEDVGECWVCGHEEFF